MPHDAVCNLDTIASVLVEIQLETLTWSSFVGLCVYIVTAAYDIDLSESTEEIIRGPWVSNPVE